VAIGDGVPPRRSVRSPADLLGVALVTGAGRGVGAAIARALAGDGWAVAVNDLPGLAGASAAGVVSDVRAAGGIGEVFGADVTDQDAVRTMIAEVQDRLGSVDVLVLNATGPQPVIGVAELTWADQLDQLRFFVHSPTILVQAVLAGMRERGRGRIVNIGSDMAERAQPGCSAYAAAKAAQLALTRTWARELGRYGITVNLIAPGWIPVERHADTPGHLLESYASEVPLGRLGAPDDVAAAVGFLASDAAAFITGQRIAVNGGHTLS
jgi:3-oxoacyl-[acyl-carrier protein] reductase